MRILLIVLASAFSLFISLTLIGAVVLGTLMDRRLRGDE
jgi:hypothetical protein